MDDVAHRAYVENNINDFTNEIDSFQTDSPRRFVDSIPLVSTTNGGIGGLAVDGSGKRLFVSTYDASYKVGISIYSTATGHALLGRISTPMPNGSELAVDPVAGRLYAVEDRDIAVYQSSPPFALLASYPNVYPNQYYSVAADSTTGKVYLFISETYNNFVTASFTDTYDGSNLGHRLAHTAIGTQFPGVLAIDTLGRRLYVTAPSSFPANDSGPPSVINAYTIDGGIALVGSIPVRSLSGRNGIAVAPLRTSNAAPRRRVNGLR